MDIGTDHTARRSGPFVYQPWPQMRFQRQTVPPQLWKVKAAQVYLSRKGRPTDRAYWLIIAWQPQTDERKYVVSNAPPTTPLQVLLRVAFHRRHVEHVFRVAKGEIGLGHFEGRSYQGLIRHMILCQLVMRFVAEQTDRLRGEKPTGDAGASRPRLERVVPALA